MNFINALKDRQDRLLAFFDAILAIAITMMALEIRIPEIGTLDSAQRYAFFSDVTCYLISFIAIGTLWYIHNNFFSNHDSVASSTLIILHLVLLFVITLFQPVTRAIGEYPTDIWVRVIYIVTFLLMYGISTVIFIIVRTAEDKRQERTEFVKQAFQNVQNQNGQGETGVGPWMSEYGEWGKLLNIAYAVNNPEELMKAAQDKLPDDYVDMINEMKIRREKVFRTSIISTMIMAVSVSVAVVCLMFPIWLCYVALGIGVGAVILVRVVSGKNIIHAPDDH